MKRITDLKPQIKKPTRYNVYLDNVFYCGLELETIMKHRLKIGTEIEESELDEIQLDSERLKALDKAFDFISRSQKTEKQVTDFLFQRGYIKKTVDEVISSMKSYGYIDDEDYASRYAKSYSDKKGKKLIALELRKKGLSDKGIESALTEIGDQTDGALSIAEKYMKEGKSPAYIARFTMEFIGAAIAGVSTRIREQYGDIPFVYAGGVMSDSIIRDELTALHDCVFAKPEFSCDNAAGTAVLASIKDSI